MCARRRRRTKGESADGAVIKRSQMRDGGPGSDLQISIIGTADTAAVAGGYRGDDPQVVRFQTADGQGLLESQVQQWVEAMAAFAPPPMGQTTLGDTYQPLIPVIKATWAA